ncbi:MAG: alpha/beta hydrolase [Bacteroides sp.]|nr:alpha/beta hydrolase [Bacteroides sp.]
MKRIFSLLLLLLGVSAAAFSQTWQRDTLGGDFQCRYFDQGSDYSGPVRSTLVRLLPKERASVATLYIHGFNDYFFQADMARRFVDHGYAFFAIDLRKYGRSLTKGQKRCQVRNFDEYSADLDSAFAAIRSEGYDHIVLMGHSTGGLVATYYLDSHPSTKVDALILNSPFLDWNLGKKEWLIGAVSALGAIFPNIGISSGSGTAYGESLNADYHGEWQFNTDWKSITPTRVDLGWIRAVNQAQKYVRKHPYDISAPILLMYSARSVDEESWSEKVDRADAVLDVKDIRKYGMQLGHDLTAIKVNGGRHDLVLSEPDVREPLYDYIFSWLQRTLRSEKISIRA